MRKFVYSAVLVASVFFIFLALVQKELPHETALNLLSGLDKTQKGKIMYTFEDSASTTWHYLPWNSFERPGVSLKELDQQQEAEVFKLLQFFLSKKGYEKTRAIIELEDVLKELEKNPVKRDKEQYFVSFYGEPSASEPWGFHFQGHHVSLNFTIVGEEVSYTPRFFGANPANVPSGPKKGLRVLKAEEDMAFELVGMLNDAQKEKAIIQDKSFYDIQSTNLADVSPSIPDLENIKGKGLAVKEMDADQQKLLFAIIGEYISAVPKEVAEARMKIIQEEEEKDQIRFGWAGATEHGKGHYYFIMGEEFLIEFDNTQNNANHIHTVWRDYDGDWGKDLIREHYKSSDHHH